MTSLGRWQSVWRQLGASNADEGLYRQLVACYSETHRKYHTIQHLDECFVHLEHVRELADHPEEIELALWFHDAIYDTSKKDNEQRSADWVLVDIDLGILGAEVARFDEYEIQVREEYSWVPESLYRAARRKVLEEFVHRE
jgi:predicted metal-dependent HD superfamily phosphohydrolase